VRVTTVTIDMCFLLDMFKNCGTFEVVESPLPENAQLRQVYYDGVRNVWKCVFEHESFEDIKDGRALPSIGSFTVRRVSEMSK
jgi:hypothetical protein